MQVKVQLLGLLTNRFPAYGRARTIEVNDGDTIKELRERMDLPEEQIHFVSVNGKLTEEKYELSEGDEIVFFPAASGG